MKFIDIYNCIGNDFIRHFVTIWAASSLHWVRLFQGRLSQIVELLTHSVSTRWIAWTNVVPEFRLLSHLRETSLTCLNLCPIRPGANCEKKSVMGFRPFHHDVLPVSFYVSSLFISSYYYYYYYYFQEIWEPEPPVTFRICTGLLLDRFTFDYFPPLFSTFRFSFSFPSQIVFFLIFFSSRCTILFIFHSCLWLLCIFINFFTVLFFSLFPLSISSHFLLTGRQHRRCIIPQTVTHSLLLLKMGKIISRNMLSWLELLISRYGCIYLVVYIIYISDARSSKYQIMKYICWLNI